MPAPVTRAEFLIALVMILLLEGTLSLLPKVDTLDRQLNPNLTQSLDYLEAFHQKHPEGVDWLFLGTSITADGIRPHRLQSGERTAPQSFNLAFIGTSQWSMPLVMDYYRWRYPLPKHVVMEVHPYSASDEYHRTEKNHHWINTKNTLIILLMHDKRLIGPFLLLKHLSWFEKCRLLIKAFSPLARHGNQLAFFSPIPIPPPLHSEADVKPDGWLKCQNYYPVPEPNTEYFKHHRYNCALVSDYRYNKSLERISPFLGTLNGMDLTLLALPSQCQTYGVNLNSPAFQGFINQLQSVTGAPLITLPPLPDNGYCDIFHANPNGADFLTHHLSEQLTER